jgi:AsmA protein
MGTLIKWLLGLVLFVVILLAAAVVIVPMVVDPNDYKPQIVATAEQKLGRSLAIEQDLRLSVFPWLGLETGGVRVGNAPGFEAPYFAEVEELGVKVKLMPLLSQRVEVDTLVIRGLRLNLEKDAQGRTNWDDLAAEQAPGEDQAPAPDEAAAPLALSIQGIRIEDARVSWDDRQAGQQYVIEGLRLVTGVLEPGREVPVEAGVTFSSSQPAMTLKAALETRVSSDAELTRLSAAGLVLELDASGEGLPAGGARLNLAADLVIDRQADSLRVEGLKISGPAMSAEGELTVQAMQADPAVSGSLRIAETNPKTLAAMFAAPIETTDPDALTRAGGSIAFNYAQGVLKLDPLELQLDESNLQGHLHLLDPAGPVVRTRLALDRIDLDRYMPPAQEAPAAAAPAASPADAGAGAPQAAGDPFAALRTLDFVGDFSVGELKVGNARMSGVKAKVVSSKGVLKVDPASADLYQGKYAGSVVLDASGRQPKVAAKQALTGIQIGELLEDLAGEGRLVGRGEVQADVRVTGLSEAEIRRSLNGNARFAFRDGALKGVNIAQIVRDASSRLGLADGGIDTGTPGQTDFTELSGSFDMRDGVIRNDDLAAKSPLLRVEGKGEVDLPQDRIDYLITTHLVGSLAGQGGKGRDELAGVPIPIRVTGSLASPSYRPDLEAALSAKAKAQIEEKKQELQQKAQDKIQEQLGDKLKGLFR